MLKKKLAIHIKCVYKRIMELNIEKIQKELDRLERPRKWLAGQIGVDRQLVDYWFKHRTIKAADRIAKALGYDPKDLIL